MLDLDESLSGSDSSDVMMDSGIFQNEAEGIESDRTAVINKDLLSIKGIWRNLLPIMDLQDPGHQGPLVFLT